MNETHLNKLPKETRESDKNTKKKENKIEKERKEILRPYKTPQGEPGISE